MWWFIALFVLFSCESKKEEVVNVKELFRIRGCTDCHDTRRFLVGPSFLEVAERYRRVKDAEEKLIRSIREGSCNKWKGRYECMPPQRLEEEEARAMAKWILNFTSTPQNRP
jgi:cytochrome c